MYHLTNATDLFQSAFYYIFYLTEKLLPFIPCRLWLFAFLLNKRRKHRIHSAQSLIPIKLRALQLLKAI